ncbi:MAG: LPS export ABC transporter periplasmic protein LptC [Dysgonamonadaceae bacterium]|jgi:LPS export ABC transporter protein LptC|nr:LPS export ABC transporter periplasmic protein LptC [Dysgonamonadaceae bacterium]MDD4246121.1 LPS export ABC transporter periplasmic protein LptC [Dysgonamonadaceae bacterium]
MKLDSITIVFIAIVMLFLYTACSNTEDLIDINYDPETTPSMNTDSVTMLVSDSGITRYKIVTDNWQIFDKAAEPYWYFPEGIYIEQFDSIFQVEAKILADTAWRYTEKNLWRVKGNVDIRNRKGEMFLSDELFWNQQSHKIYSDKYIEIIRGETELKGYGFESNQEMTEYRIFRPHDGKIPFREEDEESMEVLENDTIRNVDE